MGFSLSLNGFIVSDRSDRLCGGIQGLFLLAQAMVLWISAAVFVLDVMDTITKGSGYLHSYGVEYGVRVAARVLELLAIGVGTSTFIAPCSAGNCLRNFLHS